MYLMINPADAESRNLLDGERVTARNERGRAGCSCWQADRTPPGRTEGTGGSNSPDVPVNALTSSLTDGGGGGRGSTFMTQIEVEKSKETDIFCLSNISDHTFENRICRGFTDMIYALRLQTTSQTSGFTP